jgi:hypothetical protein
MADQKTDFSSSGLVGMDQKSQAKKHTFNTLHVVCPAPTPPHTHAQRARETLVTREKHARRAGSGPCWVCVARAASGAHNVSHRHKRVDLLRLPVHAGEDGL